MNNDSNNLVLLFLALISISQTPPLQSIVCFDTTHNNMEQA
jgi:hypothetical protein